MVNLTIDGKLISVNENTTIMEAAAQNDIRIPKLCYLKGINEIAACRVCIVELFCHCRGRAAKLQSVQRAQKVSGSTVEAGSVLPPRLKALALSDCLPNSNCTDIPIPYMHQSAG